MSFLFFFFFFSVSFSPFVICWSVTVAVRLRGGGSVPITLGVSFSSLSSFFC